MTHAEIEAVLARWREALATRDLEALAAHYADDCVVVSPLAKGAIQGRDAITRVNSTFFHAFPDVTFACDEVLVDGDRAVQVGTLTGTDTGGLMGMVPSGRVATIPIVLFYRFRDGRVVYERRIYDFTGLLIQIGVLKAKPA